jgi:hypothetical protein
MNKKLIALRKEVALAKRSWEKAKDAVRVEFLVGTNDSLNKAVLDAENASERYYTKRQEYLEFAAATPEPPATQADDGAIVVVIVF